jgi:hypothetical protein
MPQLPDPELNYGGCLVEEEIPPNWGEDIKESTALTDTALPLDYPDISMGGCVVEEEIPPQKWDDSIQGTTPNVIGPLNEATGIDLDDCWAEEETHLKLHVDEPVHPTLASHDFPSPRRLTEDHLNLIFEMRRDMVDQLQSQRTLNRRLDMLFDSLSSEPAKSHCPTCCQPFSFTFRHDGSRVRHKFSFFTVMLSGLVRMHLQSNYVVERLWYTGLPMNL